MEIKDVNNQIKSWHINISTIFLFGYILNFVLRHLKSLEWLIFPTIGIFVLNIIYSFYLIRFISKNKSSVLNLKKNYTQSIITLLVNIAFTIFILCTHFFI